MSQYENYKESKARYNLQRSKSVRDIGELPPVGNPELREKCRRDFRLFCESYFKHRFFLGWSNDHLRAITKIEDCVLRGGQFAWAQPRGSGKSTLCEVAVIWSMVYGHRRFVILIGSDESHAAETLDSIKVELEGNELLLRDFPEVCFPLAKLEGISHRCQGQLCKGMRTHVRWTAKEIRLPSIAGSPSSGATLRTTGIEGRIRGAKSTTAGGESLRPDLAVIDDPQTDESARSVSQSWWREQIVSGAILGLSGPTVKIAAFMPCTVIRRGDLADIILDRAKHAEWQGERFKLLYSMPTAVKLWEQYAELRKRSLMERGDISLATEFYGERRAEMDAGAVVAWEERHNPDELSAIQHAMNLRAQNEAAFYSEYQNEPLEDVTTTTVMTADAIAGKVNKFKRNEVPPDAAAITAYIDVQKHCLFYVVTAWSDKGNGWVLDYGTYPKQPGYFKYSEVQSTLEKTYPKLSTEAAVHEALKTLVDDLLAREYGELSIDRILIDSGYLTDVIYAFCRGYKNVWAAKGISVKAKNKPISEYTTKAGERKGNHWMLSRKSGKRLVLIDVNYWKTGVFSRLTRHIADDGSLSLWGDKATEHRMFAEHLTAEYPVAITAPEYGRTLDEWQEKPNRDNHYFDCLVGCTAASSILLPQTNISRRQTDPKRNLDNKKTGAPKRRQINVVF